jgi:organic radical activating enzyme
MNLIIEVTRECNLRCDHCLRGEPENKSIQEKNVISLFKQIENGEINTLTLTGGEPALRPDKIQMILDVAKIYNVEIRNFYIATNGTIASDYFLKVLMELYLYCSDNEVSSVDISNDTFHNKELIQKNTKKFQMFSFIRYKHSPEGDRYKYLLQNELEMFEGYHETNDNFPNYIYDYKDLDASHIINQGRGKDYGDKEPFITTLASIEEDPYLIEDLEIYLNCNGDIILGCDWSYETQEEYKLCHVSGFGEYLNKLTERI